jgi:hypothetical protein
MASNTEGAMRQVAAVCSIATLMAMLILGLLIA